MDAVYDPASVAPDPADRAPSHLARAAAAEVWQAQWEHPFVRGLADGSLSSERFGSFIRQDYLYLQEYGRALAFAAARAPRPELTLRLVGLAHDTLGAEMDLHRGFAARWGISEDELDAETPAPITRAYVNHLLSATALQDFSQAVGALLPCMWGYSELGRRLAGEARPEHPLYAEWIELYASDAFAEQARWCCQLYDALAAGTDDVGRCRMLDAFLVSSRYELAFWDVGWAVGG